MQYPHLQIIYTKTCATCNRYRIQGKGCTAATFCTLPVIVHQPVQEVGTMGWPVLIGNRFCSARSSVPGKSCTLRCVAKGSGTHATLLVRRLLCHVHVGSRAGNIYLLCSQPPPASCVHTKSHTPLWAGR